MRHDVIRDKAVPALLYAPAPHGTSTAMRKTDGVSSPSVRQALLPI